VITQGRKSQQKKHFIPFSRAGIALPKDPRDQRENHKDVKSVNPALPLIFVSDVFQHPEVISKAECDYDQADVAKIFRQFSAL
jgi:hypothetical protein